MTVQEAIDILVGVIATNSEEENEALDMAIEALSNNQNPSVSEVKTNTNSVSATDMIYRADAIDAIQKWRVVYDEDTDLIDTIKQLPSAQRTGEWLRYGEDGNPNEEDTVFWQCDQCLETYTGRTTRIPNYCPNCGADMRGEKRVND